MIALCVGLLYTYLTIPEPMIVIKYPTPFNVGQVTYQDQNQVCYQYHIKKTGMSPQSIEN